MNYSLRSLFLVVTLITVVLGVRIEYRRRTAAYHERKAMKTGNPQKAIITPTLLDSSTKR